MTVLAEFRVIGVPRPLYHYTCSHAATKLRWRGVLIPAQQPLLSDAALVWLTDLDRPEVEALGLTSHVLPCDRTEYRYRVVNPNDPNIHPWHEVRHHYNIDGVAQLEQCRDPSHWYIAATPIPVDRDSQFTADIIALADHFSPWSFTEHDVTS